MPNSSMLLEVSNMKALDYEITIVISWPKPPIYWQQTLIKKAKPVYQQRKILTCIPIYFAYNNNVCLSSPDQARWQIEGEIFTASVS